MSKVWTSEELARECKNCEVASAGRIRSQAETIRQLRETIAQMRKERSMFVRESIRHERAILGLKHAVRMVCKKRDDQASAMKEIGDRLEVFFGQIDGTFSPPCVTGVYRIARFGIGGAKC